MRIKSVCFDLDGTLYDFLKVMRHSLAIALVEIIREIPECREILSVNKMIEIRNRTAQELKGIVFNLEEIRLMSFRNTLNHCGVDDDNFAKHLNQLYLKHRFEDVELFGDVAPTLEALQPKYILSILSNGNSYPEILGVERYFQFVILAQEVGIEKPDPGIFHLAIERAGCLPGEFLYVGDSQTDDIVGARKAGVKIAWFNRINAKLQPDIPRPDYEIDRLSKLLEILEI